MAMACLNILQYVSDQEETGQKIYKIQKMDFRENSDLGNLKSTVLHVQYEDSRIPPSANYGKKMHLR